ncbi:hypothetical protein JIX56_28125 [Streptomyces sp. CA-210063]|uniref:hypothetical protein n=1 Tax=Streptomyces sp. CA-210063 TaxID=2801029 RepID=UPI00214CABAB|nr:hypothetical protein [Streptomyces sp. CA-210063]UUU33408.1 hypothetical protein JIX56_28125 [Streptomyces sp. CA-210063]
MIGRRRLSASAVVVFTFACVLALLVAPFAGGVARAAEKPTVTLSKSQAGTGGSVTVTGSGWRPKTILMILICGRSEPSRGVPGGTDTCANADGRAVTADGKGHFEREVPVAEPPVPCPCVVHVSTITGPKAEADAVLQVAGHSVEPLPQEATGGRLSLLTDGRLKGSSGLLTWFGAPPARELVFTVGNVGTSPVENPVFQVGTSHGVFAPQWEEQRWRGTIQPGRKALVTLPVDLAAGAHGDYTVSLKYGGKVLAEQSWGVGRPWGVTLFWLMLCVVVPAALFRIGMAVVDRVRPGRTTAGRRGRGRGWRMPELPVWVPRLGTSTAAHAQPRTSSRTRTASTLPWFTPDNDPGATGAARLSVRQEDTST